LQVRALREAQGMTGAELAERAEIRPATLSDIENGKTSRIELAVLERLANALGVPPGMLFVQDTAPAKKRGR